MMLDMLILETKRLIIRPFVMEDLEAVYNSGLELDQRLGTDKMHTLPSAPNGSVGCAQSHSMPSCTNLRMAIERSSAVKW